MYVILYIAGINFFVCQTHGYNLQFYIGEIQLIMMVYLGETRVSIQVVPDLSVVILERGDEYDGLPWVN